MNIVKIAILVWSLFLPQVMGLGADPFTVSALLETNDALPAVRVKFEIPAGHFLYAESISVTAFEPFRLVAHSVPAPVKVLDKFSEEEKEVYKQTFEAVYKVENGAGGVLNVNVAYQGCDENVCFFPQEKTFIFELTSISAEQNVQPVASANMVLESDWSLLITNFVVSGKTAGYLNVQKFTDFLKKARSQDTKKSDALTLFRERGLIWTALLLLIGGLALNLTPCVFPLIPINLAILGAGTKARTKTEGFVLGGLYGLAMALVYGVLGIVVVLTGSKFGTLNASPWFNVVIALIFVVLSFAMFDLINIDLSRWQSGLSQQRLAKHGHYALSFFMGAVSALLAGACVAPVVISALLLASSLYAQGIKLALLFPLLLGLGMGLPWPFAGAGLAVLPKPGAWMNWIKRGFGILILGMAGYYGYLAYGLFNTQAPGNQTTTSSDPAADSNLQLASALQQSTQTRQPVFIDFWATWCKNCHAMEATTFKDPDVKQQLTDFIVVKYQAEFPNKSPAKEVLDYFEAVGLPTYVILTPR